MKTVEVLNIIKPRDALLALVFCLTCVEVMAAHPLSIAPSTRGIVGDGGHYQLHIVRCHDGKNFGITRWRETNMWCLGVKQSNVCAKKKIKIAKKACKGQSGNEPWVSN